MPTFGLVVEGTYDGAVLTELIRKCVGSHSEMVIRICGGSIMRKFPGLLEAFRYVKQGTHVDKAVVVRDVNGNDPTELIQLMQDKIANRQYPFPVKCVVIVRELETWLPADDKAISQVTQEYAGRTVSPINEPLETLPNPKERLKQLLVGVGVPYTSEVARKIAAALDTERLRYRCPAFGTFEEAVVDC